MLGLNYATSHTHFMIPLNGEVALINWATLFHITVLQIGVLMHGQTDIKQWLSHYKTSLNII